MTQPITALFDTREDARRAIHALRDHGVKEDQISVLAGGDASLDAEGKAASTPPGKDQGLSTTTPGDAGKGAAEGAAVGAGLGLAAALASLLIPGFGLVTAGGALATALGGAAATAAGGALAGGVTGYLADLGVPDEAARDYAEGIRRGGVFVSIAPTDDATTPEVRQILAKYHGREAGAYDGAPTV